MNGKITLVELAEQSKAYRGTGGVSAENMMYGFQPAFLDRDSRDIHLSCDAAGVPVQFHSFEGIPAAWVVERDVHGRPCAVKSSVVAGFVRDGYFFTREQAAQLVQWELDKIAS